MVTIGTKKSRIRLGIFFYVMSTLVVAFWLIPLVIAIFTSAKSMDELMSSPYMWSLPKNWSIESFVKVWTSAGMSRYVVNTFIITIPSVIGALLISSLSAYALAFYKFKGNKFLLLLFVSGMLIPFQMLMIPVYRFSDQLGINNTYWSVILFHIAFQIGFCTFFLRNFMKGIPFSIFEAAIVDGASDFRIYSQLILPLSVPSMAALGVLEFTWIWNDLLWSLVLLQSDKLKPVTLGLANMQGEFISYYNQLAAGSLIAAFFPLIVFLIFQRYFIEGLTMGADKG